MKCADASFMINFQIISIFYDNLYMYNQEMESKKF